MNCPTCGRVIVNSQLLQRLAGVEHELVDVAKRILKTASDPISGVMHFLHERPENTSLHGYLVKRVLIESFGGMEHIPGLVNVLAGHVKEVIRHANVISVINEHPAVEKWGSYLIKQKDRIKFEIGRERDKLVLKNIVGLSCVEHGIEAALEKILINPPKLEVTLKLGLLSPKRIVDII